MAQLPAVPFASSRLFEERQGAGMEPPEAQAGLRLDR